MKGETSISSDDSSQLLTPNPTRTVPSLPEVRRRSLPLSVIQGERGPSRTLLKRIVQSRNISCLHSLATSFFWSILLETHPDALQPTCSARSQKRQALHSSIPQTTQSNTACRSRHSQKTLKLLKQRTAVSFVSGGTYRTEEKSVGYPTQSQPHLLAGVMLLGKVDLSARAGNYF